VRYFSVHNIIWRALPERFGKWNSAAIMHLLPRLGDGQLCD
jgi:hypothetical protein